MKKTKICEPRRLTPADERRATVGAVEGAFAAAGLLLAFLGAVALVAAIAAIIGGL